MTFVEDLTRGELSMLLRDTDVRVIGNQTVTPIFQFSTAWKPIANGTSSTYRFPDSLDSTLRRSYSVPAIYRWKIVGPDQKELAVYYGECADLVKRLRGYLKPSEGRTPGRGQLTNIRLNARFKQEIEKGATVNLELFEFENFE